MQDLPIPSSLKLFEEHEKFPLGEWSQEAAEAVIELAKGHPPASVIAHYIGWYREVDIEDGETKMVPDGKLVMQVFGEEVEFGEAMGIHEMEESLRINGIENMEVRAQTAWLKAQKPEKWNPKIQVDIKTEHKVVDMTAMSQQRLEELERELLETKDQEALPEGD